MTISKSEVDMIEFVSKYEQPSVDASVSVWMKYVSNILHDYYEEILDEPGDDESDWQHRKAKWRASGTGEVTFLIDNIISPSIHFEENRALEKEDGPSFNEPRPGVTYTPPEY